MASLNTQSNSLPLESIPYCPDAEVILLSDKRKQLQKALTPQEKRYVSASALLKGLDPDLVRSLSAHSAFTDQSPDTQFVAHARFAQAGNGPEADPIVFAA